MNKKTLNKQEPTVIYVIYIILLLIFLISINYYLFSKIQSFQLSKKLKSELERNKGLIGLSDYFFNGQRILENAGNKLSLCDDSPNCLEFKNPTNKWSGSINYKNPVLLADNNIIKLSLKSVNGRGAINLVGNLSEDPVSWWSGRKEINIFLDKNELYINTISGNSLSYIDIFKGDIPSDENGFINFYLLTDKLGSKISLFDINSQEFKNLKYSDVFTDKNKGFFPNGHIYLGILTEAYSSFKIADFYIMPAIINASIR